MKRPASIIIFTIATSLTLTGCASNTTPQPQVDLIVEEETSTKIKSPKGHELPDSNNTTLLPLNEMYDYELVDYDSKIPQMAHKGVDVIVPEGTPVYSVGDGTIRTIGFKSGLHL